jgi:hypothetical protein
MLVGPAAFVFYPVTQRLEARNKLERAGVPYYWLYLLLSCSRALSSKARAIRSAGRESHFIQKLTSPAAKAAGLVSFIFRCYAENIDSGCPASIVSFDASLSDSRDICFSWNICPQYG